jgi:hypothetical protein
VRFGPDTELFGANVDADQVRAMLDRFPDTPRGDLIARIRSSDNGEGDRVVSQVVR